MKYDFPDCTLFEITEENNGFKISINGNTYNTHTYNLGFGQEYTIPIISKEDASPTTFAAIVNILYELGVNARLYISRQIGSTYETLNMPDFPILQIYNNKEFKYIANEHKNLCTVTQDYIILTTDLSPRQISILANISREL